jgi:hypothetical protein
LAEIERGRREPEPEGLDYVKVGLGLVFVFGAFVLEAAMETSLTVKEADRMLSELAGGGHLTVESTGAALRYSLPGKRVAELGGPGPPT